MSSRADKKRVFGWVMYDWANSAFALTVMAAFFPVFFKQYWCSGMDPVASTARLGVATAIAGLMVAVMAPILGAFADAGKNRITYLGAFLLLGASSTASLFFVAQGACLAALLIFVAANIGFSCANMFYDSLLVLICRREDTDRISSLGYAVGYLGCALLFAFNMFMVSAPARFGLPDAAAAIRVSFVIVALWWILFAIPLFVFVREQGSKGHITGLALAGNAARNLMHTARCIVSHRVLRMFLIAYWLYIDGVHTFIRMAADFGLAIGLSSTHLMTALLCVQIVAFPSALAFGRLARYTGTLGSIGIGIGLYIIVISLGAFFVHTWPQFLFLACLSAVPQGCLQALSRSWFARMVPADKTAEFFGFYDLVGKSAVIIGPLLVGACAVAAQQAGASQMMASRTGFGSLVILFVAGGLLLLDFRKRKW